MIPSKKAFLQLQMEKNSSSESDDEDLDEDEFDGNDDSIHKPLHQVK